jgi:hypothetical protein
MKYFKELKKRLIDTNLHFAMHDICMDFVQECQIEGKNPKTQLKKMFEGASIFYNANEYRNLVLVGIYSPLQDARHGHYDLQEPIIRLLAFIHQFKLEK